MRRTSEAHIDVFETLMAVRSALSIAQSKVKERIEETIVERKSE